MESELMRLVSAMVERVEEISEEARVFDGKGNKAAGTRARKAMLELRNLCNEARKAIQAAKNAG